jgi:uncharacterized OB-fold protein
MSQQICWCCGDTRLHPNSELCTECHAENIAIVEMLDREVA